MYVNTVNFSLTGVFL